MANELAESIKLLKELICNYHDVSEKELNKKTNDDIMALLKFTEDISKPKGGDIIKYKELLKKLKQVLIHLPSADPLLPICKKNVNELYLAREILEKGVIISVMDNDIKSFTIYMAQLFIYYFDFKNVLQKSAKQNAILGVYLLHLLSSNSIGDFHMTLEIISIEDQNDPYIKYVLELEQHIMDGYFHYILTKKDDIPLYLYSIFMDRLYDTIKYKLADCIFSSSNSISLLYTCELLKLKDENELYQFITEYNEIKTAQGEDNLIWEIKDNKIYFKNQIEHAQELPSIEIMNNIIGYATELEKIV
ncbi:26S proteasome regulatory subunit RPN12, putative [Plasmodium chabaudi chabaudi]|uniref:26S proteasome regulatory subunit RPN12, putative n=2 Tax=Plasmodium chabaudi TaxID=5825 RepID=A0A077TM58_PLACU|nr:26S proteasome regulatory subunit RPN12, putative [Plasmodium chabaudi chabaudi]SCM01541.1 26S proteasome regulatory subunit RPN12, putative [Plasmodium chabaudi adami]SCL98344.1 26S proteasome regulatory subunit RPN12, putative [Plasmodium chabaudi chabaudi]SCL99081.1 26S proteasome regulatory subunit RPN12, putative [Plasmodium chabaudi chabaudi]SCM06467.1 26S proteasome regulatory subunit RPN12, putative [Plasmodium chabaudi adami]VTZ67238.1 26S proteasome regulatory subunit RPN12, putat|eukprot:XP_745773.1 26S proteasome regulatory subunit S14, putative [Plasmodium chabaudi chabaudi]